MIRLGFISFCGSWDSVDEMQPFLLKAAKQAVLSSRTSVYFFPLSLECRNLDQSLKVSFNWCIGNVSPKGVGARTKKEIQFLFYLLGRNLAILKGIIQEFPSVIPKITLYLPVTIFEAFWVLYARLLKSSSALMFSLSFLSVCIDGQVLVVDLVNNRFLRQVSITYFSVSSF